MTELRVGGRLVDRERALHFAAHYLNDGLGWGYPSYDAYDSAHALGPLTDADFLAPVLLSVGRTYNIRLYESLQGVRAQLQATLDCIPETVRLVDADERQIELIGELFSTLDGGGIPGARGTVLAKVLHRKRPAFIPLYDRYVDAVYRGDPPFPVSRGPGRSWRQFVVLLAAAMREDLQREASFWRQIVDLAPSARPITDVRALDIVTWHVGQESQG
jgi:hypothetical protein